MSVSTIIVTGPVGVGKTAVAQEIGLLLLDAKVPHATAHAPRIHWATTERDAVDALTPLSLLHRRIDEAVATAPAP